MALLNNGKRRTTEKDGKKEHQKTKTDLKKECSEHISRTAAGR